MNNVITHPLGNVAEVHRGTVPAKPTDSDEGIPFFGLVELAPDRSGPCRRVEPDLATGAITLETGDVVVALMSKIGRSALVTPSDAGAVLGRECAVIKPGREITGAWIYVWTQSARFREQIERHTSGTTMPRLGYRALAGLEIPVPSADVQGRAAAVLEDFDDAMHRVNHLQTYLTELRALEVELLLADSEDSE